MIPTKSEVLALEVELVQMIEQRDYWMKEAIRLGWAEEKPNETRDPGWWRPKHTEECLKLGRAGRTSRGCHCGADHQ